jgi:hypothetical protein
VIGRIQRRDIAAPGAALQAATPATDSHPIRTTDNAFAALVLSYRAATLSTGCLRAPSDAGSPINQTKLGLCVRHFVPLYWCFC